MSSWIHSASVSLLRTLLTCHTTKAFPSQMLRPPPTVSKHHWRTTNLPPWKRHGPTSPRPEEHERGQERERAVGEEHRSHQVPARLAWTGPGWRNRVAVPRTGEPTGPREVSEGRKRKQQQQQFHSVPEKLASKKSDKRREHVEKMWDMTHLGPAVWIASDKSTLLPWLKKQPDQRPSGKKRTWRWLAAERKRFSGAQHPCIQLPSHPFRKNHSPKGGRGSDTQVHHGEEGPWCHEGGHGRVGRHAPPFRPCKETSRRLQKK